MSLENDLEVGEDAEGKGSKSWDWLGFGEEEQVWVERGLISFVKTPV